MSTKEILLEVAEQLPPDATLLDAIVQIESRRTAALIEADSTSPAWHEPILKERLRALNDGTAQFMTVDEVWESLQRSELR